MEKVQNCGKCDSQGLRYQEDIWGGYQNCINCGWENMVWAVSEDTEYGLVKWQNQTGQREGYAVHSASIGQAIPHDLRKRLLSPSVSDLVNDTKIVF